MARKVIKYYPFEVHEMVLKDAGVKTGVPVDELEAHLSEDGAVVGRKDGGDLVPISQQDRTRQALQSLKPVAGTDPDFNYEQGVPKS